MAILVVGRLEPSLEKQLTDRHTPLRLPVDAEQAEDVTVIVCNGRPGVDAALMDSLPQLRAIVNFGAGYDAIDVTAARDRGIGGVSNTPDVLNDTVADTALGLILDTLRRFPAADRYVRAGRWAIDGPFPYTRDLTGSRVGILGLGRIGSAIATRLRGFDCAIAYHNRHEIPPGSPYRYAASPVELAADVDVLVVVTAGGPPDTAHLVDREVLAALGPDGYLINVARGSVVDQNVLIEFLEQGRLAGAAWTSTRPSPTCPFGYGNSTTWCCCRTWAAQQPEPERPWPLWRCATWRSSSPAVSW